MPLMDVVCCGYVAADGNTVKCGKVFKHKPISAEMAAEYKRQGFQLVTHGTCPKCYRAQFRENAKREARKRR